MADKAHEQTDLILERMEKRLSAIYTDAADNVGKRWKKYLKGQKEKLKELQDEYDRAKKSGDYNKIRAAGIKLQRAKTNLTVMDRRFRNLTNQLAEEISNVNRTAVAYINDELPGIYALNYNALNGEIAGYSFTLVDPETIKYLAESDKNLLPYKKINGVLDIRWNVGIINSQVLQGILAGEPMDDIADRLQNVLGMDKASAIRNARTAVTSAENKGRLNSYEKAESEGIILEKEWLATSDSRTREAHRLLNGKTAKVDEPFSSELGDIMYPGDPAAEPANVYNCRCTLKAKVLGFDKIH